MNKSNNMNSSKGEVLVKKDWFIQKKDGSIDDYYTTTSKKVKIADF